MISLGEMNKILGDWLREPPLAIPEMQDVLRIRDLVAQDNSDAFLQLWKWKRYCLAPMSYEEAAVAKMIDECFWGSYRRWL